MGQVPLDRSLTEQIDSQTRNEFYFITACGEEARHWMAEFCDADNIELRLIIADALRRLRRHELAVGLELLGSVDRRLHSKVFGFASVESLLWRFEYAARAYADYLTGNLESAKANLLSAHREIARIIGLHEFLIPLAIHCTDFIIQRARIARRERSWAEARQYIDTLEKIFVSCHPFCVLGSGRPILLSDIQEFLGSLPLDEEQRARTRLFLGEDSPVCERIEQLEERIFALPDMVIPYP
ncbi:MAG: hypothetical protein QOF89_3759 [Acidobacteriota bacterium]|jgi:hypothetical protein|nr:hypothetical protein [Acidobacteriota bacterium]